MSTKVPTKSSHKLVGWGGRWGVESASFMALLGVLNQPTMKCCQYEGLTSLSRGLSGSESAGKALGVHE